MATPLVVGADAVCEDVGVVVAERVPTGVEKFTTVPSATAVPSVFLTVAVIVDVPTLVVAAAFNALLGPRGWLNTLLMDWFNLSRAPIRQTKLLDAQRTVQSLHMSPAGPVAVRGEDGHIAEFAHFLRESEKSRRLNAVVVGYKDMHGKISDF